MVEESLAEIKWLLVDAAGTYFPKTGTNSPNLNPELCIFLETGEGKVEVVYAAPNLAYKHTFVLVTRRISFSRMEKILRSNHGRVARQMAGYGPITMTHQEGILLTKSSVTGVLVQIH